MGKDVQICHGSFWGCIRFFFQVVVFFWGVTSPPFYNTTLPYSKKRTFVIVLCILHSTWILYPQKEVDSITTSPFYGP